MDNERNTVRQGVVSPLTVIAKELTASIKPSQKRFVNHSYHSLIVMKKIVSLAVGAALFIAGYQHSRRHAEFIAAKATLASPVYSVPPMSYSPKTKPTFAFRLTKSS